MKKLPLELGERDFKNSIQRERGPRSRNEALKGVPRAYDKKVMGSRAGDNKPQPEE